MFDVKITIGESPKDVFESIRQTNKAHSKIFDLLSMLESIMINSNIDNDWKQKIMKELIKHGYTWDGGAHEANQIFGESYGIDWR